MRLTCPNCSARYEVADNMVPPEGRDVQCSNCSTTWFQPGRRTDQTLSPPVAAPSGAAPPAPTPVAAPPSAPAVTTPPAPPPAPAVVPVPPQSQAAPAPAVTPARDEENGPQRRTLDPTLRDILAQEAEREARLRRAEAGTVETQAEMPLGEESDAVNRARKRAELDDAPDAFSPANADGRRTTPPARDLFPDIDEINSTLRDTGDRSDSDEDASDIDTLDTLPRRRRGARIGFLTVLAIAAGVVALYVNAGRVAISVPTLAPAMAGYVQAVNDARFWLDDLAQGLAGDTPSD